MNYSLNLASIVSISSEVSIEYILRSATLGNLFDLFLRASMTMNSRLYYIVLMLLDRDTSVAKRGKWWAKASCWKWSLRGCLSEQNEHFFSQIPNLKCSLRLISIGPTKKRLSLSIFYRRRLILSKDCLSLKILCSLKNMINEFGVVFLRRRALTIDETIHFDGVDHF